MSMCNKDWIDYVMGNKFASQNIPNDGTSMRLRCDMSEGVSPVSDLVSLLIVCASRRLADH